MGKFTAAGNEKDLKKKIDEWPGILDQCNCNSQKPPEGFKIHHDWRKKYINCKLRK